MLLCTFGWVCFINSCIHDGRYSICIPSVDVTMHFVNGSTLSPVSMYTVLEDEGSLPVCVMLVGASRKLVTMTITTRNGSANGNDVCSFHVSYDPDR